ncbi:hypothetical protein E2C01_015482 [Portunus trituberculatus]|uniref:Uncharacterized protein n=1 Tax=Portunus trituberculatus TaxID=210409 RepID=A0A5B7DNB4_PORTR|nr:hypothetical protein [Portunus trituberculatus]
MNMEMRHGTQGVKTPPQPHGVKGNTLFRTRPVISLWS